MSRLAPNLTRIIMHVGAYWDDTEMPRTKEAVAELRVLVAVAKAAERVAADAVGDPFSIEHLCTLDRAVARLRKVSRSPRPGRQRAAPPRPPTSSKAPPARRRKTR